MPTIDLDCPPGGLRPGDLIIAVVKDTPAEPFAAPDNPVSTFFGNWTWHFDLPDNVWVHYVQPVIKPRIESLYHDGHIRYGSW
jgi:hypothetical protein